MSRRGMKWYKHEPIAFLDGVQGLGPETIGAYVVLLDLIYCRDGVTVRDDRHLSGILGCSVRKATALTDRLIDKGKIVLCDGFLSNNRAETTLKSARNTFEKRSNAQRERRENEAALNKNSGLQNKSDTSEATLEGEEEKEEESVSKETACGAADFDRGTVTSSQDSARNLFTNGLRILVDMGIAEKQARSVIGRWRKNYDDALVIGALVACEEAQVSEPISWITAFLSKRSAKNGKAEKPSGVGPVDLDLSYQITARKIKAGKAVGEHALWGHTANHMLSEGLVTIEEIRAARRGHHQWLILTMGHARADQRIAELGRGQSNDAEEIEGTDDHDDA